MVVLAAGPGERAAREQAVARLDRDVGLIAVLPVVSALVHVPAVRVDGGDHPVSGDRTGDLPPPVGSIGIVGGLHVLPRRSAPAAERLCRLLVQFRRRERVQDRSCVSDQSGQAIPGDGEFQDARWHDVDALPAYELGLLSRALHRDSQTAFTFSGIPHAVAGRCTLIALISYSPSSPGIGGGLSCLIALTEMGDPLAQGAPQISVTEYACSPGQSARCSPGLALLAASARTEQVAQ